MVSQHTKTPEEPPRSLSPEVKEQLGQALREFASATRPVVTDALRRALERAGHDAREQKLRPEELILVLKAMEQRIGVRLPDSETAGGAAFRTRLIRALLEAYYDRVDAEAEMREQLRRGLERALMSLKESSQHIGEAERAVADYCRERHREGARAETVIVEIKHIALPILREDYGHLETLVTKCIRHFYGDSADEATTD
jgi:hypothetical protein